MTEKSWWTSFFSCAMDESTVAARHLVWCFFLIDWVRALFLLTWSVSCVRYLVLCAGADVCNLVLCFLVWCLCFVVLEWSTLRSDGIDNWGIWEIFGVMDLVCRVSLLVYSGTLEIDGTPVFIGVDAVLDILLCIARSIIWSNFRIPFSPFPLPKFFIALAKSSIAAINFSACVMVGWVSFLWLKWMVSVKR